MLPQTSASVRYAGSHVKTIFFGSPDFAVPCLQALLEFTDVVAVITQPDRPAGRGLSLRKPPVKVCAKRAGVEIHQPTKVRTAAFADLLRSYEADVGVVVAYGRILPRAVLGAPRLGCVNVHASLLPRWRGAAPIQWAVAEGDTESGVTLMQMDEGMDTGPLLASRRIELDPNETAGQLSKRLSDLGSLILREELGAYVEGKLTPQKQDGMQATHARLLKKSDGEVDWRLDVGQVHNLIRGMNPWPGATTNAGVQQLKIHRARIHSHDSFEGSSPGMICGFSDNALLVACGRGVLGIDELQQSGKKRMGADRFATGHLLSKGTLLSSKDQP